jgi:DegV family protein with EDD domain
LTKIGLVTDSSSDIPSGIAERYGIEIVPMYIGFENSLRRDLIEITPEEVYAALGEGKKVTTSAPSAGDFREAFNRLLEKQDIDIIYCITLSSKLSGAYNAANIAKNSFPSDVIKVIDSRTSTMCLGLIVLEVAKAIEAGYQAAEIGKRMQELVEKSKFIATLESFEYVFKGGRAVFFSKFIGKVIRFLPILDIGKNGKVRLKKFVKNKENALNEIYRQSVAAAKMNSSNRIGIFYGLDITPAKELERLISQNKEIKVEEIIMSKITTVISAHTGPGIWGVAISPKLI